MLKQYSRKFRLCKEIKIRNFDEKRRKGKRGNGILKSGKVSELIVKKFDKCVVLR